MRQDDNRDSSQNAKDKQQRSGETIDTCTMDPCPMKTEVKDNRTVKCPECGKTDVPGNLKQRQDQPMKKLEKKTVLITGGLSGIGNACAVAAANEGANIAVADIKSANVDIAMAAITKVNPKAIFIY